MSERDTCGDSKKQKRNKTEQNKAQQNKTGREKKNNLFLKNKSMNLKVDQ